MKFKAPRLYMALVPFAGFYAALQPIPSSADLFVCYQYGKVSLRRQPAGRCTRLLAPPSDTQRAAKSTPQPPASSGSSTVTASLHDVQTQLRQLGYQPGPSDGIFGRRTRQAIEAFQADHGLAVTGRVDATLLDALQKAD